MTKAGAYLVRGGAFLLGVGVCVIIQKGGNKMLLGDGSAATSPPKPNVHPAAATTAQPTSTPRDPPGMLLDEQTMLSKYDCLPELAYEVIAREEPALLLVVCRENPQLASEILTLYCDLVPERTLHDIRAIVPAGDSDGAYQGLNRLANGELAVRFVASSTAEKAHEFISQLPEEQQRHLSYALALGAPELASKLSDQLAGTKVSAFLDSCLDGFAARSVPAAVVNSLASSGTIDSGLLRDCLANWAVSSPLDAAAYINLLPVTERDAFRGSVSNFLKSYGAVQKQFDNAFQ